ncbi:uncharacterized protein LOC124439148 isoform X2 [Xenia sp. Carnegie-2017]|uniref:uncharacterized protein LOC124439148 isoform X2 n=1 Tax=Xenia sp. Carnegie-2017 TaxID=2897299 RepID=UPI001F03B6BC|nr:uncharacterized protein LOC124439148 isoform X2 [Xenia sp. Carnegie-2017]
MYIYWYVWISVFFLTVNFVSIFSAPVNLSECKKNEFGIVSKNGKLTCRNCSYLPKCPKGQGLSIDCGDLVPSSTRIQCLKCIPGETYSENYDRKSCRPCKSVDCHLNEKINGKCEMNRDTSSCGGVCKTGYYPEKINSLDNCKPCSLCPDSHTTRIKKCENDGEPWDRQCHVRVNGTIHRFQNHPEMRKKGCFMFYCNLGWFVSTLALIVVGFVCILIIIHKRCRMPRKNNFPVVVTGFGEPDVEGRPSPAIGLNSMSDSPDSISNNNAKDIQVQVYPQSKMTPTQNSDQKDMSSTGRKSSASRKVSNTSVLPGVPEREPVNLTSGDTSSSMGQTRNTKLTRQHSYPTTHDEGKEPKSTRRFSFDFAQRRTRKESKASEDSVPLINEFDEKHREEHHDQSYLNLNTLSRRLSINQLNCEAYRKLCNKLNDDMGNKDWRTLAGNIGYSAGEVRDFSREKSPADALLQSWKTTSHEHDIPALIELLKKMERNDLVKLLESQPDKPSVT